jgi:hypothetical protein
MTTLKADIISPHQRGSASGIKIPDILDIPGSIIQTQHRITNTTTTLASPTAGVYAATDCFVEITPKKENSKILVVSHNTIGNRFGNSVAMLKMMRSIAGGSYTKVSTNSAGTTSGGTYNMAVGSFDNDSATGLTDAAMMNDAFTMCCFDLPDTTSQITYKVYLASNSTAPVYHNITSEDYSSSGNQWFGTSYITAYEVSQE